MGQEGTLGHLYFYVQSGELGLPDIHFPQLRNTYTTILL